MVNCYVCYVAYATQFKFLENTDRTKTGARQKQRYVSLLRIDTIFVPNAVVITVSQ